MGQCYAGEEVGMADAAIACFRNAVQCGDREGVALQQLARRACRCSLLAARCAALQRGCSYGG